MRIAREFLRLICLCAALAALLYAPSLAAADVTVAWSSNAEPDIAGYKVWYGTGGVLQSRDVGNVTSATISGLTAGVSYNIYATAYNTAGLESGPSTAVIYVAAGTLSAPVITTQPISQTLLAGSVVNLTVQVSNAVSAQFQWYLNGTPISGANAATFTITSLQAINAGTYTVAISNSAGSVTSSGATVALLAAPGIRPTITVQPASKTVVSGSPASLAVEAVSSVPMTYQWYKDSMPIKNATAPVLSLSSAQVIDAGSYLVRVMTQYASVFSQAALLTVSSDVPTTPAPPLITLQPVSQSVTLGSPLYLAVQATGNGTLAYQWSRNGTAIAGATSSALQIASVQSSDAGSYAVTVSNAGGSVASAAATVTVQAPVVDAPFIIVQPQSQTVPAGAALLLSVKASGTSLQYQWYRNGVPLQGAVWETFQIDSLRSGDAGSYTVVVSNSGGAVTSSPAVVAVNTAPAITLQPVSQSVTLGSTLTLLVGATGSDPLAYQWFRKGLPIQNATNPSLIIAAIQPDDSGSYSVTVSNSMGIATSSFATITIISPPSITLQPASQTLPLGASLTLTVAVLGSDPLQYQWFRDGITLENGNAASLQISALQASDFGTYTVRISNSAGTVTSAPASIGLIAAPLITVQPLSQALAPGDALNLSVIASGPGSLQYQWTKNGVEIQGAKSSTFQISAIQTSDAGAYRVKVSNSAGTVTSDAAAITLLAAPVITLQPLGQTVVPGSACSLTVQASGSGTLRLQWSRNGTYVQNATNATLSFASVQSSDAGSYTVTVSNSAGSVSSSAALLTVLVAPTIAVQPASQAILPGETLNLSVKASGSTPLQFQWFRNGAALPNATSASLQIASAQNTDEGSYKVVISNPAGTVTSSIAIVTIVDAPAITAQPLSQTVAPGATLVLSVQASGSNPLTYQWFRNGAPLATGTNATLNIASILSSDAGTYTVTITNAAGSVLSAPAIVTVIGPPAITLQPTSQTVLAGAELNLAVEASGSAPLKFQWSRNSIPISTATSPTLRISPVQTSDAGSYTVTISNPAGSVTSSQAVVTVLAPPVITEQPLSQSLAIGSSLDLSVKTTGASPMTFKWYRNGTAIPSANKAVFHLTSVSVSDSGAYAVKVTNADGSTTSADANIVVVAPPSIVTQLSSRTLPTGAPLVLSIQASGTAPFTFEWFRNGLPLANGTESSYQAASVQLSDSGSYSVKVSNSAGTVTSSAALITVLAAPAFTAQPESQTLAVGAPLLLSAAATGSDPLRFQWRRDGLVIMNATNASLQLSAIQSSDAGVYTLQVSNLVGMITSAPALVSVLAPPAITTQPLTQSVREGSTATFTVVATGTGPLLYQWYRNDAALANSTAATLSFAVTTNSAAVYRVTVANQLGSVSSANAELTVLTTGGKTIKPNNGAAKDGTKGNKAAGIEDAAPLVAGQISLASLGSSGLQLRTLGTPGHLYEIQGTENLPATQWTALATVAASETGLVEFVTQDPFVLGARFYRVVLQQP